MNLWNNLSKNPSQILLYALFLAILTLALFQFKHLILLSTAIIILLFIIFLLLNPKWQKIVSSSLLTFPLLLISLITHPTHSFSSFFVLVNIGLAELLLTEKTKKTHAHFIMISYLLFFIFGFFVFPKHEQKVLLGFDLFIWILIFLIFQNILHENRNITKRYFQLEEEKNQLLTENLKLSNQISHLNQTINEISSKYSQIEKKYQQLKTEKEKIQSSLLEKEQLLQNMEQQNSTLKQINEQLFSNLHREDTYWITQILHLIQEQVQAYGCAYYFYDQQNQNWHCIASTNLNNEWLTTHLNQQYLHAVAQNKEWIELFADENQESLLSIEGNLHIALRYVALVPLLYANECVGILFLGFLEKPEEKKLWEPLFRELAQGFFAYQKQIEIRQLIRNLQEKNEILAQQEEELRQNLAALEQAHREMEQAQRELQKLNETLEEKVKERTKELEKTLQELKNTQDQLILSEKMAALGQLVANIAHEINTPLGAVKASAENIEAIIPSLLDGLKQFSQFNSSYQTLLLALIQEIYHDKQTYTSKEERRIRKMIQKELEAHHLMDNADHIARKLVEAGFHGSIESYIPLFQDPSHIDPILNLIYSYGQVKLNISNILIASNKTRKIIFALKSYAHTQQEEKIVTTDLIENIETVLTLYYNQLKHGIEVIRDFPNKEVKIKAYPDKLTQVWTNLISNAIQAMAGKGRLEIRIDEEAEHYIVHIIDNGPGIPPEIQDKIFEPFFTTKAKGEGTGLGLDICRRIIEEHGGKIKVRSEPGFTCFSVILPKNHIPKD